MTEGIQQLGRLINLCRRAESGQSGLRVKRLDA